MIPFYNILNIFSGISSYLKVEMILFPFSVCLFFASFFVPLTNRWTFLSCRPRHFGKNVTNVPVNMNLKKCFSILCNYQMFKKASYFIYLKRSVCDDGIGGLS